MRAALFIATNVPHRLRRHSASYTAIALAAFASWAGIPGPGEAALIAGGAFAGRHRLDIVQVEAYAFAGALVGGMVGWGVGWRIGADVAGRPGPLHKLRHRGLRAGERFFARFGPLAVFLTPSWVAGIHRVRPGRFVIYNALACLAWTAGYGLTTYFAGPRVAEWLGDLGIAATVALAVGVAVAAGLALVRARRRRGRRVA